MDKAVCQGSWHAVCDAFVRFTVTSSHHDNIVRQSILAHTTVQDQLICSRLHRSRGRVQLVQEQHHNGILAGSFFIGQFNRGSPVHLASVLVVERDTTNVCGLHLTQSQVNHKAAQLGSDAFHQFGFANARRAPQEQRALGLECFEDRLASLLRSHGASI